jgi:hypothetical protein
MSRKPKSPAGKCRDCHADVFWAQMPSGKMVPFDQDPDQRGNVVLFKRPDGTLRAQVVPRSAQSTGKVRRCHFDTCTAREHQKQQGGQQRRGAPAGAPAAPGSHGALVSIVLVYQDGTQLRVRPQAVHEVLPRNTDAGDRRAAAH